MCSDIVTLRGGECTCVEYYGAMEGRGPRARSMLSDAFEIQTQDLSTAKVVRHMRFKGGEGAEGPWGAVRSHPGSTQVSLLNFKSVQHFNKAHLSYLGSCL